MLGRVLNAIGKKDEAILAFEQAEEMEPTNADHPFLPALSFAEMNRTQVAVLIYI